MPGALVAMPLLLVASCYFQRTNAKILTQEVSYSLAVQIGLQEVLASTAESRQELDRLNC